MNSSTITKEGTMEKVATAENSPTIEKKATAKSIYGILLILFIISLIPLYVIGLYAHPSVDDYYYGTYTAPVWNETHSVLEVIATSWDQMVKTYVEWQGNFSAIFLMRLQPSVFGENLYFIAPFLLLTTYVLATIFFFTTVLKFVAGADKYRARIISISVAFVSMQLVAVPSDSFYWFNGSIYYTFFYSLMIVLFGLMIKAHYIPKRRLTSALSSAILAFFIGGSNYATALFTSIILVLTVGTYIYIIANETKTKSSLAAHSSDDVSTSDASTAGVSTRATSLRSMLIYAAVITLACLTGLFISILAPGNAIRQASVGGSTGLVKTFAYTFAYGGYSLAAMLNAPTLIFFVCIIPVLYRLAKKTTYSFRWPLLVLIFTFGLYSSCGTPVFYAQGLRIPYRMTNIIYFTAFSFVGFNLFYFLGYLARRTATAPALSDIENALTRSFDNIRTNARKSYITLAIVCFAFLVACIGRITITEEGEKTGKASFNNLPTSISATLSLVNGDAATYDRELTERDAYLRETELMHIIVPALTATPAPIFHVDITDDPGDWHNAHLAMFYGKEIIWTE